MASSPTPSLIPARSISKPPDSIFLIVGVTSSGKAFRPSDWSERLAGVMACFQPPGSGGGGGGGGVGGVVLSSTTPSASIATPLQCSPYAVPGRHQDQTCVRVDPAIATVEPLALSFLLNFARDNDLQLALTSDFT
jgi:hypothetical protein